MTTYGSDPDSEQADQKLCDFLALSMCRTHADVIRQPRQTGDFFAALATADKTTKAKHLPSFLPSLLLLDLNKSSRQTACRSLEQNLELI